MAPAIDRTVVAPGETLTPEDLRLPFSTDEILWYADGRWGEAGYAIANGQGKSWTDNTTVFELHSAIGRMVFELMHREDAKFADPPHKTFWWDWQLALLMCRRLLDQAAIDPGTTKLFDAAHVTATPRHFRCWPVPFFGSRVRQADIRFQCEMALKLLGEIQQHSANERTYYVTGHFARRVNGYLTEMHRVVAVKYFGYTSADVVAKGSEFAIEDARFGSEQYQPQFKIPEYELSSERPQQQWWPTENDLSNIAGIPYPLAIQFARRYPVVDLNAEGDWETTLPGIVNRVIDMPVSRSSEQTGEQQTPTTATASASSVIDAVGGGPPN